MNILGARAAAIRTRLLQIECQVVEKVVSMKSTVSQRLQQLKEIAKSKIIAQSSNGNACFSSAFVKSNCIKSISASGKEEEKTAL